MVYTRFAIGGRYLGLVLALECHFRGWGDLGGFEVTSLRSLLLPENPGYKEMQRRAETGFQRERLTIQGMWMKTVVQLKEELLLAVRATKARAGPPTGSTHPSLCPELEEPSVSCLGCSR